MEVQVMEIINHHFAIQLFPLFAINFYYMDVGGAAHCKYRRKIKN